MINCSTVSVGIPGAQKYVQFCQLMLAIKTRAPNYDLSEGDDRLMRRRHPLIPELREIFNARSIQGRLCTMAHQQRLAQYPGVTQIYATLQQT